MMVREADGGLHTNAYPRLHRVGPDAPDTPWCIRLADQDQLYRLLCFDFDGKDSAGHVVDELMERAVEECDALSALLTEMAIKHVVCRSSGSGGRHIWIALKDPATATQAAAAARAARANYRTLDHGMLLNPREGAARPPGAPHRDGSYSEVLTGGLDSLLSPTTTLQQLTAITDALTERAPAPRAEDTQPSGPVDAAHAAHRPLSNWGLAHMATIGGGNNPSWTGFMCLLAAASAGWTLQDVDHAARTAPGMEHYRTKNTGRGRRRPRAAAERHARLERQWAKAQEIANLRRTLPAARPPSDLTDLETIVNSVDDLLTRLRVSPGRWGRTEAGASQRSVLTALAYLALHTGKRTVAASIRDLAQMVGLGRTTVSDALTALAEGGFIERAHQHDGSNAAEWRLTLDFSTTYGTVRSQPLKNPRPPADLFAHRTALLDQIETQLTDQRHDLFSRAGLGHMAGQLYAALRHHSGLTVETAARALGIGTRYTTIILSRLRKARLIIRHKTDGWAKSQRDLRDSVARKLGLAGILEERRRRYQVERDVWAWWQAELSTMTSTPRARPRRPGVTSRELFDATSAPGERLWPPYPRSADGRANHREARYYVDAGYLSPTSRWQLSYAA